MLLIILLCVTPFTADRVEIINEQGVSIVHLLGNVTIEDEDIKITCSEASLHESEDYVVLVDDISIVDKSGEIKADFAVYHFNDKKGYLKDSVALLTGNEIITADSLFYDGVEELVQMFKDVTIEDKKNNLTAHGEEGWYNLRDDEGYLSKSPRLEIARENKDPMKVNAHEFRLLTNSNQFFGYDSVVAIIDSITVFCDTFLYNLKDDHGSMKNPFVVEKENELKGESGKFEMKNKEIETFSVHRGWSQYYTEEGSKNVVEGEEISIVFHDGKAIKIIVDGEPKGVLRLKRSTDDAGNE
jgi:lipopolysaccharide assembly outer membrane protein LptD (OstA)